MKCLRVSGRHEGLVQRDSIRSYRESLPEARITGVNMRVQVVASFIVSRVSPLDFAWASI